MKILVLGSSGQVGSEIEKAFELTYKSYESLKIDFRLANRLDIDVVNRKDLLLFLKKQSPEWIINAAAYTSVDEAELNPKIAYDINKIAVETLVDYCAENECRLIHISTDYVFSGLNKGLIKESEPTIPISIYGKSKLAGEKYIHENLKSSIIIRTSWVFGLNGNNFVKTMLNLAYKKEEVSIVGDQYGSPTSAIGIAETIAKLIYIMKDAPKSDKRWGIYHYSGNPYVSWAEYAEKIFDFAVQLKIIAKAPKINHISTDAFPTIAKRPMNSRLDCSKIKKTFGIEQDNWIMTLKKMLFQIHLEKSI